MTAPRALKKITDTVWEIPADYKNGMNVSARIVATQTLLDSMDDGVFEQVTNVATLPGVVSHAFCMPDGHWGYAFPIGGLAAMDPETGVISPGGIGFDINCGMRLVATSLTLDEVKPRLRTLVDKLFESVPTGVGCTGFVNVSRDGFREVVERGASWCIDNGYGEPDDLETTEEHGCMAGADASKVSDRAVERGYRQIGTLGSGNHYLEIQVARENDIFDRETARSFGITQPGQVVVMFHCGSRGFGHQVATDYLHLFLDAMKRKFHINTPERELACAPFNSREGRDYFAAMKCAVNMSYVNRQVILHRIREVFSDVFHRTPEELGIRQIYDVAHNTAMLERHVLDGSPRELLVHRKGATRAFGPGHPSLPLRFRETGQPVILGGSMETGSYLLAGMASAADTFFTTAHGSGRTMSRSKARKLTDGKKLRNELEKRGIYIRTASFAGLAEEAGNAYKDIDEVVTATERAGLTRRIARLTPIGNIKG